MMLWWRKSCPLSTPGGKLLPAGVRDRFGESSPAGGQQSLLLLGIFKGFWIHSSRLDTYLWSSWVAKAPVDTLSPSQADGAAHAGWLCLPALRPPACGMAVWETPAPGETQEGVESPSGPDMRRARPLAEMLLTAVFESAYFSYYLQCTWIRPTAGDCSSQSMRQTSPSLHGV